MFEISSQEILCVRVARFQRYDLQQKICGQLHPVVLSRGKCQKIECARKIGFQSHSRFQLLSSFLIPSSLKKEPAQVVMNSGRHGIKARGLLKLFESATPVILVDESDAQVQVRLRRIWLQRNNFSETLHGIFTALGLSFEHPQRGISRGIFRVDLYCGSEFLLGFRKITEPCHCQAEIHMSLNIIRVVLDCLSKKWRRFRVLPLLSV